jgi:uncharacterized protein (TIGR03086 family)
MDVTTLRAATDHFAAVLSGVEPSRYGDPTPCPDWSVEQLIDHVIGGQHWAALLLAGEDGREALGRIMTMTFAADRRDSLAEAAAVQERAFAAAAPDTPVRHMIGIVPAAHFLGMRIGDVLIHSWDLARAVGADETIPPTLVAAGLAIFEPQAERIASTGRFGAGPVGAPEPADDQQRLLHLTGRRP